MACTGWINADVAKRLIAHIGSAMAGVARHINRHARLKGQHPAFACRLIFQEHDTPAGKADVDLRSFTPSVEMPLGHEIFLADLAGMDEADAIMEIALASAWFDRFYRIYQWIALGTGDSIGGLVNKDALEVREAPLNPPCARERARFRIEAAQQSIHVEVKKRGSAHASVLTRALIVAHC